MTEFKSKCNEAKYVKGVQLVAEQLMIIITEDECDEYEADDYIEAAFQDIQDRVYELQVDKKYDIR